jgi:xylulokinase
MSVLPETVEPCTLAGKIGSNGALWSGLKKGTPVITGSTDTVMEVFSAGSKDDGDCTVKLATFGRICIITSKPHYGKGLINYSYLIPGKWYPGTGTKSCGTSFRWCRDQFFSELDKDEAYPIMTEKAGKIPSGSQGLIFHPYLQGEGSPYDDPLLRGDFIGLTLHHTRDHIARAILEGTCFSLLDSLNFIKEKNIEIKPPLRFIGGGTRSNLWTQILADILGYDAVIPRNTDPSIGAALLAGVGAGIFSNLNQAQEFNRGILREIYFEPGKNSEYLEIFNIYKDTQSRLEDINHELAGKYDA